MALTVKRRPANQHQQEMGRIIVTVTRGRGGDNESCAGAVATAIQESTLTNLSGGDRDSLGLFQQRPSMGWGSAAQIRDPRYATNKFLDQFLRYRQQGLGWLQASHKTQRSAHPNAPAAWYSEGMAFATGVAGSAEGSEVGGLRVIPYEFSRGEPGKPETSWDCMGRLAEEVAWRRFTMGGELWYVSDDWLEKQPPYYRLSEEARGVLNMSFEFETRMPNATEMAVQVQARRYAVLPGMVVKVEEEGPADGNWLISDVRRDLAHDVDELKLVRKRPRLPEPAPKTESVGVGGSQQEIGGRSAGSVYEAAEAASRLNWRYSQPRRNDNGQNGYADCSSGVTWVLRKAGVRTPPSSGGNAPVSGMYMNWGNAGRGKEYTVWANAGHIWIQHHGKAHWRFDTGGGSGGKNWPTPRSTGGFVARHL